ncbi:MAG: LuxR C-terminal-related transcriptional regulator, partial [Actinomycetota bacterium]|nr:LuxR C-terminal-related transcriptional regulator [Actinomycetota bacterium]
MPPLSRREAEVLTALGERLTNAEIAGRLYVSVRTVETYVSSLLRKFNAENRRELADIARNRSSAADASNLRPLPPRLTAIVGRGEDVAAVKALLDLCRLATLTGPAGVGKTRLAIEVAATIGRKADTQIAFVDLTSATDEATVLAAAAAAVGVTSDGGRSIPDALQHRLRAAGPLVVVVDNCEHVLDAASRFVIDGLAVNEGLKVLTTSRERLGIPGEHVYAVLPLAERAAAELFWERASAVEPNYGAPASSTEEAARSICRRLDGLPLAIELA